MLQPTDVLSVFAPRLTACGVEWMVAGGVAAILYGEPRLTQDVDVVMKLGVGDAVRLAQSFPSSEFYSPPVGVIEEEAGRPAHGHLRQEGASERHFRDMQSAHV